MNHCLFKAKDTKGAVGNTVDYSSLTIRKALPDIPIASLYRHIKILADSSILMVVGENRIRGTVESVYQLNEVYVRTLWR